MTDDTRDLLTDAACECLSPDQMDKFEALFADEDMRQRFTRCVMKRAALLASKPALAVKAWLTDDGRVISDSQKQQALKDGGASASSVRPYSVALGELIAPPAAPAQAQPVAYFINDSAPGMKPHYSQIDEQFKHDKDVFALYAAPLPTSTVKRVEVSDAEIHLAMIEATRRSKSAGANWHWVKVFAKQLLAAQSTAGGE
ncbi:MAG TPA: hypothetical protein VF534_17885 [Paraburkholderia sp.]